MLVTLICEIRSLNSTILSVYQTQCSQEGWVSSSILSEARKDAHCYFSVDMGWRPRVYSLLAITEEVDQWMRGRSHSTQSRRGHE